MVLPKTIDIRKDAAQHSGTSERSLVEQGNSSQPDMDTIEDNQSLKKPVYIVPKKSAMDGRLTSGQKAENKEKGQTVLPVLMDFQPDEQGVYHLVKHNASSSCHPRRNSTMAKGMEPFSEYKTYQGKQ